MALFRHQKPWQTLATPQPVELVIPAGRRGAVVTQVLDVSGSVVSSIDIRTAWTGPDSTTSYTGTNFPVLGTRLSSPLLPFLVSNDFFETVAGLTPAQPVPVRLPVDTDPYDGKTWRVLADSGELAQAVLDPDLWRWLEHEGERRMLTYWIDGEHLCCRKPQRHPEQAAAHLVDLARLIEGRIASGALKPWQRLPEPPERVAPQRVPAARTVPGSDWALRTIDRDLLFFLWDMYPGHDYAGMYRGSLDGVDFTVAKPLGLGCLVLLRLPQRIPSRVRFAPASAGQHGNVHTEWLDFDDDFAVRARDEQVGHAVTTPLLMAYLYDHGLRRLDVKDQWMVVRLRKFDAAHITEAVQVMDGARRLLPRFQL